jgi:CRISPR-associated protein Cas2
MLTIISYDIVHDRRRIKVMKYLKGWGVRVQYSVFECTLTADEFTQVQRVLGKLIDRTTDSIRCYRLDAAAVKRIQIVGIGTVTRDPTHYIIGGDA